MFAFAVEGTWQAKQLDEPLSETVPLVHLVQFAWPGLLAYMPASQSTHVALDAKENLPAEMSVTSDNESDRYQQGTRNTFLHAKRSQQRCTTTITGCKDRNAPWASNAVSRSGTCRTLHAADAVVGDESEGKTSESGG